jgi:serine/threonine protein kinase
MGVVWEAEDQTLQVPVALKAIRFEGLDAAIQRQLKARALREARSAAKLRGHPHVVTVYDLVEDSGVPWIVMELVAGRSLNEVLHDDGPVSSVRGAEIGLAVLDALAFAARQGIVHRDVKPANILLADAGGVKLTDFGIASLRDATNITFSDQTPMTTAYVAPERLRDLPATPTSDIFSLGVTLYEALEGVSPFRRGSNVATMHAVAHDDLPELTRTPRWGALLRAMTAKDPAERELASRVQGRLSAIGPGSPRASERFRRASAKLFHHVIDSRLEAIAELAQIPTHEGDTARALTAFLRRDPVGGRGLIQLRPPRTTISNASSLATIESIVDSTTFDRRTLDISAALYAVRRGISSGPCRLGPPRYASARRRLRRCRPSGGESAWRHTDQFAPRGLRPVRSRPSACSPGRR